MANFLSTGLKNLFISLGASKTSDNNYAVPLLNATTKEPVGDMAISQLASVLGVNNVTYTWMYTNETYAANFRNWALQAQRGAYFGILTAGWASFVFGYKWSNNDGCFFVAKSNGSSGIELLGYFSSNSFVVVS